ncbi:hypothetical protein CV83915_1p0091 (plasmid) [Escherichia coli]|uniref:Uncharacterized protein n=1 Tax=Escherichia coli TaxID=562 RepID=A0A2H4TK96_ECOLX|nr:hypothetical protein CV83915_1p0091 [Escherichia coli]
MVTKNILTDINHVMTVCYLSSRNLPALTGGSFTGLMYRAFIQCQ